MNEQFKKLSNYSFEINTKIIAPLLLLSYCICYFYWGERIPANNGLGWDGEFYGILASDFWHYIHFKGLNNYSVGRIFPSAVIYFTSLLFHIKLNTTTRIITAFFIFNTILTISIVYLWGLIAKYEKFTLKIFWIGFISLFFNFGVLKIYQYYLILTDIYALFFGMLFLYLYLTNKKFLIPLFSFFALFTWPTASVFAFLLLLNSKLAICDFRISFNQKIFSYVIVSISMFCIFYFTFILVQNNLPLPVDRFLLPLSSLIVAYYIFYVTKNSDFLNKMHDFIKKIPSEMKNNSIYFYVLMIFIYMIVRHFIMDYNLGHKFIDHYGYKEYFVLTLNESVLKPGIFLISHIVYWGPAFILLLLFSKSIYKTVTSKDIGLYLFFILTLVQMLGCESRELALSLSFLVYVVCTNLSKKDISWYFVFDYALISLCISKIYIPIHAPENQDFFNFPWQRYFMNFGPWMSWEGYLINLKICVFAFLAIVFSLQSDYTSLNQFDRKHRTMDDNKIMH